MKKGLFKKILVVMMCIALTLGMILVPERIK